MTTYNSIYEETQCQVVQQNSSTLDLVFAMDCTGSMGPYIHSATQNIRSIVDEIFTHERSDIHLALIEYRDHPPQDMTFVTRVHDFTEKVDEMKQWLTQCEAQGGGDTPEAVADALHDVLILSWRPETTKICILISDAPPHGLGISDDHFPKGCPADFDPIKIVRQMAENKITLYVVGVEPLIIPYRDFFMSLAYITGGQYVPLANANLLAQVIVGGVREEISLEHLMSSAREDITREIQQAEEEGVDDQEAAVRINRILRSKNTRVRRMHNTHGATSKVVEECYSKCVDMNEMQSKYKVSRAKPEHKTETETSYVLEEDSVTLEQAKRLVQKAKNRRLTKSTFPKTDGTDKKEKRQRKTKQEDEKQEDKKLKQQRRRPKIDAVEKNEPTGDTLPNDETKETNVLEQQDKTEKQEGNVKKRRGKRRNSTDRNMSKERIKRQPRKKLREIADSSNILTNDEIEPIISMDTTNDNATEQVDPLSPDQGIRFNCNSIYLILFFTIMAIIFAYFLQFK